MNHSTCGFRILLVALLACGLPLQQAGADTYRLTFELQLEPANPDAVVAIEVAQDKPMLREARFRAPLNKFGKFRGDGKIERDGDFVTWTPPDDGGRIEFRANLENQRASGNFDSLVTPDWALFRADDAFPAARVRHAKGAHSDSHLRVLLPEGWTVITPFAEDPAGEFTIDNPERAFDRPTGWVIAGKLGRRKDMIGSTEVSVAAPLNSGVERLAMLALLRWTLPYLAREIEQLPPRLSIVSAGEPMWRGGLSAGNSIYIHAERPLLSENATSTLLHEAIHVLMPVPTQRDQDWIDEGIAEYVTLRLLRDSGTISPERFQKALDGFEQRGQAIDSIATANASGAVRAKAVVIFARLDAEILALTDGEADLYDLIREVRATGKPLNKKRLKNAALALTGATRMESLEAEKPGNASSKAAESDLTK